MYERHHTIKFVYVKRARRDRSLCPEARAGDPRTFSDVEGHVRISASQLPFIQSDPEGFTSMRAFARIFRYRLLMAALAATLVSIAGWTFWRSHTQQEMVRRICLLGGSATRQPGPPSLRNFARGWLNFDGQVTWVDLTGTRVTESDLQGLDCFGQLQSLYLDGTPTTDAGLQRLAGLPNLQMLSLSNTQITDAGLQELRSHSHLRGLSLNGTDVTDDGLKQLSDLTSLPVLELRNTQVTDAGLRNLTALTNLKRLALDNTRITDAGLQQLGGLIELRELTLMNTNVTESGVAELHSMLPRCKIRVSPPAVQ